MTSWGRSTKAEVEWGIAPVDAWQLAGRCVERFQRAGAVALLESLFAPEEEDDRIDWRIYTEHARGN